jgi:HAD superfamily hydrolase (TIGR01450 family)
MPLSPLLARYDNVILDLDGCVWVGDTAIPGAPGAIAALREAGRAVAFVTNDSRRSPEEYVRKLWSLGCTAAVEEVISGGAALQFHLADRPSTGAFVIGSQAVVRHVADAGHRILNGTAHAEGAEIVVVAGYEGFEFGELRTATRAVLAGAEIVACNRDATFPTDGGLAPGCGAIVAALEYATGRHALSVGKPEPQMFAAALERMQAGSTLVVGDRLDADLGGAAAAGLDGAIVLSGVTSRGEAEAAVDPTPVAIAPDLGGLVLSG